MLWELSPFDRPAGLCYVFCFLPPAAPLSQRGSLDSQDEGKTLWAFAPELSLPFTPSRAEDEAGRAFLPRPGLETRSRRR